MKKFTAIIVAMMVGFTAFAGTGFTNGIMEKTEKQVYVIADITVGEANDQLVSFLELMSEVMIAEYGKVLSMEDLIEMGCKGFEFEAGGSLYWWSWIDGNVYTLIDGVPVTNKTGRTIVVYEAGWKFYTVIEDGKTGYINPVQNNVGFDFNTETGEVTGGVWSSIEWRSKNTLMVDKKTGIPGLR